MTAPSNTRSRTSLDHLDGGSGAGTARRRTSLLELAPLASAIPCARLHTSHVLREWDLRALAEDAALIVSELMTNAADASMVLPGRPPVTLRLLATERSVRIEVWDRSPHDLEPRAADPGAESGRGLTVVAALSVRWGSQRTGPDRKVVWAELRRPAEHLSRVTHGQTGQSGRRGVRNQ